MSGIDPSKRWSGFGLVLAGCLVCLLGIASVGQGSAAGGTGIWFLLFGGSALLVVCGIFVLSQAKTK